MWQSSAQLCKMHKPQELASVVRSSLRTDLPSLPWANRGANTKVGRAGSYGRRRHATTSMAEPNGKSAMITGANTGIGFETAKAFASQGYAVVMACRDVEKGKAARDKLKDLIPGARAEAVQMDLANLGSVRDFASRCLDGGRPLDVLVNNAGVMACPELRTDDGFELQLGVNHLGHFALTLQLLPLLSSPDRPARIVNVSSSAHMFGKINFDDLQSRKSYQNWVAYGQSKLANVLFTYEAAKRIPRSSNITFNALHPGVVKTELSRYLIGENVGWVQQQLINLWGIFLKTPEQGAATSIYLASSPEVEGITSKYFSDCRPIASSAASYDADVAARLWTVSQELTGVEAQLGAPLSV